MTDTSPDPERSILLSLDELMALPPSSRQIPDLSVSNDALRESLKPPPPVPLGTHVARFASARSNRLLWWYGTRPSWLQVTLGGMAGSLLGLGVVLSYYVSTLPEAPPEVAAEASSARLGAALVVSAAPMISERVVQALAPAAAIDAPASDALAEAEAPAYSDDAAEDSSPRDERRRSTRRHASKAQSSSGALPSWVQQHVKPQARRAALADQKAAARERKAARKAAAREKQAAARARKAKTLAQK